MMAETNSELVMVAVDGSDRSEKALDWYLDTCYQSNHQVTIVHCVEVPPMYGSVAEVTAYHAILRDCHKEAEELRTKYGEIMKRKNIEAKFYSRLDNNAAVWVVNEANEMKPKLIVVGSRGLGTIRRTILGSVSEYILHHAHCAVAVCPDVK